MQKEKKGECRAWLRKTEDMPRLLRSPSLEQLTGGFFFLGGSLGLAN
jgi:hypothetical protein